MKKKTKNILTSVFGILLALVDVSLYVASRVGAIEYDMGVVELITVAVLAYLFIHAYNDMLQNLSKKYLGIKDD